MLGEGHQCCHKAQDPYDKLDADTLHQRKNCIALEKTRSALLCICGSVTAPLRPQLRLEVRVVLTILHGAISASLPGEREKSRIRVVPTLSHGVVVVVSHVKSNVTSEGVGPFGRAFLLSLLLKLKANNRGRRLARVLNNERNTINLRPCQASARS